MASIGWIALWALISTELVLAGFGFQRSTGTSETVVLFVVATMFAGSLYLLPFAFLWTLLAGILTRALGIRGLRLMPLLLLPQIVCGSFIAFNLVKNPPSPHTFFFSRFHVQLPAGAEAIRVIGNPVVDAGNVGYTFRCKAEATRQLVDRLKLTLVPRDSAEVHQMVERFALINNQARNKPWEDSRAYLRRDGETGTGYFLLCNEEMTEVLVARDPGAFQTDADGGVDPLLAS